MPACTALQDLEQMREAVRLVGLHGIESERAGDLPIGWRQRLALATAIVHRPDPADPGRADERALTRWPAAPSGI